MAVYQITPLDLGRAEREMSFFTYFKNVGIKLTLAVPSFLVQGNGLNILVDTGMPAEASLTPAWHMPFETGPDQTMVVQLAKFGLTPSDINLVIFTHLHWDHVYNVHLLTKAHFFITKREYEYALDPVFPMHEMFYDSPSHGFKAPWRDPDYHFTKDYEEIVEGIVVFNTPGHSVGHQSVSIDTEDGRYILSGDLIPLYENWEQRTPSGMITSIEDYVKSFNRIAKMGGTVIPSHDLKMMDLLVPKSRLTKGASK